MCIFIKILNRKTSTDKQEIYHYLTYIVSQKIKMQFQRLTDNNFYKVTRVIFQTRMREYCMITLK